MGILPVGARQVEHLANENFLKDCDWIDDLSLRVSAGLTGNDAISTYRSLATLSRPQAAICSTDRSLWRLLPQPPGFPRPDMGEDHGLQRGHRLVDVQRPPEHHGRSLQIQNDRPAHVAGRCGPNRLHVALDQHRLDLEQGYRAFGREPEHRAARSSTGRRRSPCRTTNRMVDDIGPEDFISALQLAGQQHLHDVRIRQGLPAQLALGIQIRRHVEKRRGTRGKRGDEPTSARPTPTEARATTTPTTTA